MYTHSPRIPGVRRALGVAIAGVLAACALAGPAMAASDDAPGKAGGEPPASIIAIL